MHRTALPLLTLTAAAGLARADVIQQSFSYEWTSIDVQRHFSFEPFDDMGGTRTVPARRSAAWSVGFEDSG